MDTGIPLVGQSEKFDLAENSLINIDVCLSIGQQYAPSPLVYCGTIIDHATGQPLPGATVTLRNGPYTYRCRTTEQGKFEIVLPSHWSVANLQITKQGYSTRYIGTQFLDRSNQNFYVY